MHEFSLPLNDGCKTYLVNISAKTHVQAEDYLRLCRLTFDDESDLIITEPTETSQHMRLCRVASVIITGKNDTKLMC